MNLNLKKRLSSLREVSIEKMIIVGLTAGFAITGCIVAFVGQNKVSSYQASYAQNAKSIESLNKQLGEIDDGSDTTVEDIHVKLNSAATAGSAVASYQTEYGDVISTSDADMFTENQYAIAKYVDSTGGANPWFPVVSDVLSYTWTFNSTYSFTGDRVPVLWTCRPSRDGSGPLLAYTTGIYNVSSNTFTNVESHVTSIGDSYVQEQNTVEGDRTDDSIPDDALDDVNDIIDRQSSGSESPTQTSESVSDSSSSISSTETSSSDNSSERS